MVGWKSVDHCSNQHVKHVEHDKHCSTNVEIWWNFIDFWFMLMDLHGLWWLQNLSTIKIHQNLWKSIVWRCQFCFKDFNSWKIKQLLELLQKLSLQVTKARTATAQRDKRGMERSQAMVPCCEGGKFKVKIWWKYGEHLKSLWKHVKSTELEGPLFIFIQFSNSMMISRGSWSHAAENTHGEPMAYVKHQIGQWLQLCMPCCSSFSFS